MRAYTYVWRACQVGMPSRLTQTVPRILSYPYYDRVCVGGGPGGPGGPGLEQGDQSAQGGTVSQDSLPLLPYTMNLVTKMKSSHRSPLLVRILPLIFSMAFILLGTMSWLGDNSLGIAFLDWVLGVLCLVVYIINRRLEEMKREVMDHRGILVVMRLKKTE